VDSLYFWRRVTPERLLKNEEVSVWDSKEEEEDASHMRHHSHILATLSALGLESITKHEDKVEPHGRRTNPPLHLVLLLVTFPLMYYYGS
jgi:hypothetical protein